MVGCRRATRHRRPPRRRPRRRPRRPRRRAGAAPEPERRPRRARRSPLRSWRSSPGRVQGRPHHARPSAGAPASSARPGCAPIDGVTRARTVGDMGCRVRGSNGEQCQRLVSIAQHDKGGHAQVVGEGRQLGDRRGAQVLGQRPGQSDETETSAVEVVGTSLDQAVVLEGAQEPVDDGPVEPGERTTSGSESGVSATISSRARPRCSVCERVPSTGRRPRGGLLAGAASPHASEICMDKPLSRGAVTYRNVALDNRV